MRMFGQKSVEWTPANLVALRANPAWVELEKRLYVEIAKAEVAVENPDPFEHGVGVGCRRTLQLVLNDIPKMLLDEADGKTAVKALK